MKNDIFLEIKATPEPFFNKMTEYLGNNLDNKLCRSVSNLLSLDYATRLEFTPELHTYINICIKRLEKYLGARVILDNNFSKSMELFIVAITEETDDSGNAPKSQEQLIDAMIESTITQFFSDLTAQEKVNVRSILKNIINNRDKKELLSMVHDDPALLQKLVMQATKSKKSTKEVSHIVIAHLETLTKQSKHLAQKKDNTKALFGKIAISIGLFSTASLGLVFSGLLLPAIIVPAAILAIKTTPNIGEKIANNVIKNSVKIKTDTQNLNKNKAEILEKVSNITIIDKGIAEPTIEKSKAQISEELQKQGKTITNQLQTPPESKNLSSFKEKTRQANLAKNKNLSRGK